MRRAALGLIIALAVLNPGWTRGGEAVPNVFGHWSPQEVWREVDVETLPLETEIMRSWEEEGGIYVKESFVSEIASGTKIRIFGYKGVPKSAKQVPGILHIHGGGQTASLPWVQYWVKRGYACITYDFCGPWEGRTEYTDWGPLARNCSMASNGVYQVNPSPRQSGWFHWALAGRRALTLLAREPSVDPQRLGIFGISVGGTLCWLVAGSDSRVKAALPIYGCGYNVDRRKAVFGIVPTEDQLIYQEALTPEAHAPYIRCPVFFLSASNDHHGWIDDAFDSLRVVQAETRQSFTPRYIHHVDPEQGAAMSLWMDWQLRRGKPFPQTPQLSTGLDRRGVLQATVRPQDSKHVERVVVYYSLGMKIPPSRYWRRASVIDQDSHTWTASLPVMSTWDRVAVFANVFYSSGLCLSSELTTLIPGQLGKAQATLSRSTDIDDGYQGTESWFYGPAYTDPNMDRQLMMNGEKDGRHYISVNPNAFGETINFTIASHIFGDPQFQGGPGASLAFDCKGGFGTNGLTITFSQGEWMPGAINFKAQVPPNELGPGWVSLRIPLSRFSTESGAHPDKWARIDRLLLSGKTEKSEPPRFARFHWTAE